MTEHEIDKLENIVRDFLLPSNCGVDAWWTPTHGQVKSIARVFFERGEKIKALKAEVEVLRQQQAHGKPGVLPDLGELIVWLMQKAGFDEADYAEDEAAKIARAKKIVESCFAHDPRLDGLKFTEAGPGFQYEPGKKPWSDQNE